MNNIDRLRAAADKVERLAGQMVEANVSPGVPWGTDIILGQLQTAVLLRAVADEIDIDTESLGGPQWWRAHAAALALVDTILGGSDE